MPPAWIGSKMTIHVTPIPKLTPFATPALTLTTTNAEGSATSTIRSDASVLTYDAVAVDAITFGQSGAVGSATTAPRRDHAHAMASLSTQSGVAKGYCRIADDGSLVANSLNVASITASGTGDRLIVWDTDFGNVNYCVISGGTGGNLNSWFEMSSVGVGSARLRVYDNASSALADYESATIAQGDQ